MSLYAALVGALRTATFVLVWLLATCAWILQPLTREVRWAGLAVIAVAIWLQHRPRRT